LAAAFTSNQVSDSPIGIFGCGFELIISDYVVDPGLVGQRYLIDAWLFERRESDRAASKAFMAGLSGRANNAC
jgi:hypothetical protein